MQQHHAINNHTNQNEYPIRILHCVAGLGVGGYENFIMNVYRKIDRNKVQFDFLYSYDGVFEEEILSLGGKLHKIPFIVDASPLKYNKCVLEFFEKNKNYKIVHSHMDKFSGQVLRLAKKVGVPVRIAHSHSTRNLGNLIYKAVKNYYGTKIKNSCTDRLACGKDAGYWLFGRSTDFTVVTNGIDINKFKSDDNRNKKEFSIVNIARFDLVKNHTFLIDVFNEIYKHDNSSKLYLAGTGNTQLSIKNKVSSLNLDSAVTFLDVCRDIPALLSKADVLCMPSLFEGLPVSLIEAQSTGTPCVVSDNITKEVNVTGDVEFLSLQDNSEKWAEALLKHKGKEKKNNRQKMIDTGYDINMSAKYLEEFYLSKRITSK